MELARGARRAAAGATGGPACWSPWSRCAGTRRARPARRWSSAATRTWGSDRRRQPRGRPRSPGPASCSPVRRRTRAGDCTRSASATRPAPSTAAQCCGGEVTAAARAAAVGAGGRASSAWATSGYELARILARHDLDLHLVDSRAGAARPPTGWRRDSPTPWPASHVHHALLPRAGARRAAAPARTCCVMTHDHAEDYALCDAALRCAHLGTIGLIGSSAKWTPVPAQLARRRVTTRTTSPGSPCPIGAARDHRQGPGRDRRQRSPPTCCAGSALSARPRPAPTACRTMTIYRGTVPRHPRRPVHRRPAPRSERGRRAAGRRRRRHHAPAARFAAAARRAPRRAEVTRPERRAAAARLRRHPRALPAGAGDRRAGHAAARLAGAVRAARGEHGWPTAAYARRGGRRSSSTACWRAGTTTRAGVRLALRRRPWTSCSRRPRRAACASPSGLVVSDRFLRPDLLHHAGAAPHDEAPALIAALARPWAGCATRSRRGSRCRPRTSCSTPARQLLPRSTGVWFTSHINENPPRSTTVAGLFPERARLPGHLPPARPGRPRAACSRTTCTPPTPSSTVLAEHGASGRALPDQQQRPGQRAVPAAPARGARASRSRSAPTWARAPACSRAQGGAAGLLRAAPARPGRAAA